MDFKLTQEQLMLQETAGRLVRDVYGFEHREQYRQSTDGFSIRFIQQMGELGLCAVPFDEAYGGYAGNGIDNMLIMTELGRGLCLEPYLHSVILAGGLIAQLGSPAQKDRLLPQVASASLQLAVAVDEPQSHYQLHDVQTFAEPVAGMPLAVRQAIEAAREEIPASVADRPADPAVDAVRIIVGALVANQALEGIATLALDEVDDRARRVRIEDRRWAAADDFDMVERLVNTERLVAVQPAETRIVLDGDAVFEERHLRIAVGRDAADADVAAGFARRTFDPEAGDVLKSLADADRRLHPQLLGRYGRDRITRLDLLLLRVASACRDDDVFARTGSVRIGLLSAIR